MAYYPLKCNQLACQFYRCWQKSWDSGVGDKGLHYSQDISKVSFISCGLPLVPSPMALVSQPRNLSLRNSNSSQWAANRASWLLTWRVINILSILLDRKVVFCSEGRQWLLPSENVRYANLLEETILITKSPCTEMWETMENHLLCVYLLWISLFTSFAHLKKIRWFSFLLSSENYTYPGCKSFVRYMICQYFLPVCSLYFHFSRSVICRAKVFRFADKFRLLVPTLLLWAVVPVSVHFSGASQCYFNLFPGACQSETCAVVSISVSFSFGPE